MILKKHFIYFILSGFALLLFFLLNISLGSLQIPFSETLKSLSGQNLENESYDYIIRNYRIPKAFTAVLTGSGLAVSGLMTYSVPIPSRVITHPRIKAARTVIRPEGSGRFWVRTISASRSRSTI